MIRRGLRLLLVGIRLARRSVAEHGRFSIEAKVFIDASYEGDVMTAAGVKYAVGRESAEAYQEKLAGVGPTTNWTPIDPYVVPGNRHERAPAPRGCGPRTAEGCCG